MLSMDLATRRRNTSNMSDAASINQTLLQNFTEFCTWLLPNGKVEGSHYLVGGIDGSPGKSLQITLSGAAAGRWKDFATGEGGATPLWLLKAAKGLTFTHAVKEAKEWLGIKDEDYGVRKHKTKEWASAPQVDGKWNRPLEPNTKAMDYLTIERRLDPIVVAKARLGETPDGQWIIIPYFDPGEKEAFHIKKMAIDRPGGKKQITATPGTKRSLYGKHLIDENVSELVITEGEIDALSFHSWGIPAVSMPNGVSDMLWFDLDWEWLQRFEKIYVCTDMDEPGRLAAPEICKRLELHRSYIVTLPKKDANECLQAGIKREEIEKCLAQAKAIELDEIKHPDEYLEEVYDYYTTDWSKRGWETPWYPTLPWRVRKAEFTIFSGFSGSGKALSIDTPIPTPTGWTTMGKLKVGDKVFDQDGAPCNVVFATGVQWNRKCYHVEFSDGASVIADADHLWETWSPHARNSLSRDIKRVRKTENTSQRARMIKPSVVTTEEIRGTILEERWAKRSHLKHAVPVASALRLPEVSLPVEPYCLGAWLGDGSTYNATLFCGNGDEEIVDQFVKAGYPMTKHNAAKIDACPAYGIGGGFVGALREAGVLGRKHIPSWYLRASFGQRLALLQGLMDTDGFVSAGAGHCEFTSMLKNLAYEFKELLLSLGIRASVSTGIASVNGKKCGTKYRVHFTARLSVFRLKRKLARIQRKKGLAHQYRFISSVIPVDSVPVKCIQVDSLRHLYLCGEDMIPTHNTVALNHLMLHLVQQGVKVMDASLEVKPGMTLYNMTRCALGKKMSSRQEVEGCINWLNDSVFFLDCIGTVNVKRLLNAMGYARKRHGIDVFIIDSLFKCGLDPSDFGSQREFADLLTTFCNNTGAHVILVAHARKTQNGNEFSVPSKSDVAGSSDITNAAFNVIIWWRNKLKKIKLDEAKQAFPQDVEAISEWIDEPDGAAFLDKQRFGEGEEAKVHVWFCHDSYQFHTSKNKRFPFFQLK